MEQRFVKPPVDYLNSVTECEEDPGHMVRFYASSKMVMSVPIKTILDPACGSAQLERLLPKGRYKLVLSDLSKVMIPKVKAWLPEAEVSAEDLSTVIHRTPRVDCIILTETLEHLPNPVEVLRMCLGKAEYLHVSSPIWDRMEIDAERGHLWGWDTVGYIDMLRRGGWVPIRQTHVRFYGQGYDWQLYLCKQL